jgi:hypothetical protein
MRGFAQNRCYYDDRSLRLETNIQPDDPQQNEGN